MAPNLGQIALGLLLRYGHRAPAGRLPALPWLAAAVLGQPRGYVVHAQVTHEFQSGDIVLGMGHQVNGEEPTGQWPSGGVENGAGCCDRRLVPAVLTLPAVPPYRPEGRVAFIAARQAAKWPGQREAISVAWRLSLVP